MAKVYEGDSGTQIVLDTGINLAGITAQSIKCLYNGLESTWDASIDGATTIKHTLIPADTAGKTGVFKLQAYVELPSWTGRGETVELQIYKKYT